MTLPETELRRGPFEAAIPAMETNLVVTMMGRSEVNWTKQSLKLQLDSERAKQGLYS